MTKECIIKVENMTKAFGKDVVLEHINTEIYKGDIIAIIGPSGCGKSTFIRTLNLLEQPTEGAIYVDGENIVDKKVDINKIRQKVGMVFQHFNLFPNLTILSNITLAPVKTGRMNQAEADKLAMELLKRVGLSDKADVYPDTLSGGQKQRLSIARAICRKPDIYVFDDSFSALDYKTDRILRGELKKITKDAITLIVAQRIGTIADADCIVVLDDGRVAGMGTHKELLANCEVYRQIAYSQLSKEELENE
mgnify:CR=1 FL=1